MSVFGPIAAAVGVAHTAITLLIGALTPLLGEASAATATVCLTVVVCLTLLPLTLLQVRAERTRARLVPRLAALREQYGDHPERLMAQTRQLYAEEGTAPWAGCLPVLAQAPVFITLYGLYTAPGWAGRPTSCWRITRRGTAGHDLPPGRRESGDGLGAGLPGAVRAPGRRGLGGQAGGEPARARAERGARGADPGRGRPRVPALHRAPGGGRRTAGGGPLPGHEYGVDGDRADRTARGRPRRMTGPEAGAVPDGPGLSGSGSVSTPR